MFLYNISVILIIHSNVQQILNTNIKEKNNVYGSTPVRHYE